MAKILQLIHTSGPGGAENVLFEITNHLKRKYELMVGMLKPGWLYDKLRDIGIEPRIIHSGKGFDMPLIINLMRLIKQDRIDLVQSHLLDMNFYSSIASRLAGVPHISTEHGDIHHPGKRLNLKTRVKARTISHLSTRVVFVSNYTKNIFLKIAPMLEDKTAVIYNGLDIDLFETNINNEKKRTELGIDKTEIVIGNVANLYPVKGQMYLIQAAKKVLSAFPNATFLLIGRGEMGNTLSRAALDAGISNKIRLLGFRSDVKELLKIMDIFVLPSNAESMPLSIIEAMASKIPVIASDVGGISEIIYNGTSGILIPAASSDILASKIIYLLQNRAMASKIATCAYEKAKQCFGIQKMIANYEKIYRGLIK